MRVVQPPQEPPAEPLPTHLPFAVVDPIQLRPQEARQQKDAPRLQCRGCLVSGRRAGTEGEQVPGAAARIANFDPCLADAVNVVWRRAELIGRMGNWGGFERGRNLNVGAAEMGDLPSSVDSSS